MTSENNVVTIIYDGECPFCSDFVSLNRLRSFGYRVDIVNARDNDNPKIKILRNKYNLDDGMIVICSDKILYGVSAARFIAMSYSKKNTRAFFYWSLLINEKFAGISYDILVKLRKIFFKITGKSLINEDI